MTINTGDIVLCENLEWDDNLNAFILVYMALRVEDITNSGKMKTHDRHGNKRYIHALDTKQCYPRIIKVKHC